MRIYSKYTRVDETHYFCFQKIIELVGTGKAYGIVFDAMLQSCLEKLVVKVEKEWSRESCKVDEKLLGVRC